MAQKKRKKNPGLGVDFKRVKQKVGKKLQPAQNATETSFKAKRINLPSQSLAIDRSGEALSERHLSIKASKEICACALRCRYSHTRLTPAKLPLLCCMSHNAWLQELLGQCSHYSPKMRKAALAGVQQVLVRHGGEANKQVGCCLPRLETEDLL